MTSSLKPRNKYLRLLCTFQGHDIVKLITGIRGCGKSSLMQLMREHLLASGVMPEQIITLNFDNPQWCDHTADELYHYVKERVIPGQRLYLFLDELPRILDWKRTVQALRVDLDCDIYIACSNANLLISDNDSQALRYVDIKVWPLSFKEFLDFNDLELRPNSSTPDVSFDLLDRNGLRHELRKLFDLYLHLGGLTGSTNTGFDPDSNLVRLEDTFCSILVQDVINRYHRHGPQLTDANLLRDITFLLAAHTGQNFSASVLAQALGNKTQRQPSHHTVQDYLHALRKCYFLQDCPRFDLQGKRLLRTLGKYYLTDLGLRTHLAGLRPEAFPAALNHVVYLELRRREYLVASGKIGNQEIDFVTQSFTGTTYFQVTPSMLSPDEQKRVLRPLQKLRDNYPKIVLSLEPGPEHNFDGIKSLSLIDWLLDDPADQTY